MSNMSYCRFQNTVSDVRDCANNLEGKLSQDEAEARSALLLQCAHMLSGIGVVLPQNVTGTIQTFCNQQQELEDEEEEA